MKVATSDETKAFFYKMIGDYYRYVAECASEKEIDKIKNGALENYNLATKSCQTLNACNSIRLGLALNFSVFHFEVMSN